ncbi:MAG TPA: molybdopterin-dependent oxidoreductase [Ktedonobacteraceae bacterium]|nr:molybdopterin-dependent oxidoreductase [Ktedonobacteraceae bacterium]
MSPRLTDWAIAVAALLAFMAGIISLISGRTQDWFVFILHGIAGLWLLLLLWGKLRRVWPRLIHPRRWDRRTVFGLLALLLVALALVSGIWWVGGGDLYFIGFNLLNWHIILGFVVTAAIVIHMFARAKRLRKRDIAGRRRMLHFSALLLGSVAIWPTQQLAERVLNLSGARRRFTGSYESSSYAGNVFPTSSWVADAPRPLDAQTWRLTLGGAVTTPRYFSYDELIEAGDVLEATLDCTGGFYSTQHWRGIRVGRMLDHVTLYPEASSVSFISVTSYRWSLPLDEARTALLATHVEGEPLSHDHGFPLRLVAPGHRGFEWVKWITRIEVLTKPDPEQVLSIFTSSFTDAGRGK